MTIDKPLTRKAVRKPRALPPNLTSIIKLSKGGSTNGDDNVIPFVNPNEKPWYETKKGKDLLEREPGERAIKMVDLRSDREFYLQQLGKVFSQKSLKGLSIKELDELLDYTLATVGI